MVFKVKKFNQDYIVDTKCPFLQTNIFVNQKGEKKLYLKFEFFYRKNHIIYFFCRQSCSHVSNTAISFLFSVFLKKDFDWKKIVILFSFMKMVWEVLFHINHTWKWITDKHSLVWTSNIFVHSVIKFCKFRNWYLVQPRAICDNFLSIMELATITTLSNTFFCQPKDWNVLQTCGKCDCIFVNSTTNS